ncbi:MAG: hypothetical protein LW832_07495 [Parachlamydia sp.]|nr:hypothetical protein [Parachlamydia sp.]
MDAGGRLRQPIFIEIRKDKKPQEVMREKPLSIQSSRTHLDKIYWPKEGITKGDLLNYYAQVAPLLLPYLKDRPETLHRYPNGIEAPSFYQKEAGNVPSTIRTELIQHEERSIHYILIGDTESLLYTVNLGCIELNPFSSRLQSIHYPDYLIPFPEIKLINLTCDHLHL